MRWTRCVVWRRWCGAAVAVLAAAVSASPAVGQTFEWTGADSIFWGLGWEANWMPEGVPGLDPAGGGVIATIGEGSGFIQTTSTLELGSIDAQSRVGIRTFVTVHNGATMKDVYFQEANQAPRITANGTFSMLGECLWEDAILTGPGPFEFSGTSLTLVNLALGAQLLDGTTLKANGPVTQLDTISFINGGVVENNDTWTVNASQGGIDIGLTSAVGSFENHGTLVKTGSSTSHVRVPLNNTSTVRVEGGELRLRRGGEQAGASFELQDAAVVAAVGFVNGAQQSDGLDVTGPLSATGNGTFRFEGALHQIMRGGVLTTNLSTENFANGLHITGPTTQVEVAGQLVNQGVMTWDGGTVFGEGAFVNVDGAHANFNFGPHLAMTFTNTGNVVQGGDLTLTDGTIENFNASAEWRLEEEDILDGGGENLFDNSGGTLLKPGGSSSRINSDILVPYRQRNGGKIIVEGPPATATNHTLAMHGGEIQDGEVAVSGGAKLRLYGEWTLGGGGGGKATGGSGPTFTGNGTCEIGNGTVLDITGGEVVADMAFASLEDDKTFHLNGGTIGGGGVLRNEGFMRWDAGTIGIDFSGLPIGELVNASTLNIEGTALACRVTGILTNTPGAEIDLDGLTLDGGILFNDGRINLHGVISGANGGTIFNADRIDANEFGDDNDVSTISADLDNTGIVAVHNGRLFLQGDIAQLEDDCLTGGDWAVEHGAELVIPGATINCLFSGTDVLLGGEFPALADHLTQINENARVEVFSNEPGGFPLIDIPMFESNDGGFTVHGGGSVHLGGSAEGPVETSIMGETAQSLVIAANGGGPEIGRFIVDELLNNGTIRPGDDDAAGPFVLEGDLTCGPTSVLDIELGGETPIFGHDQIVVEGDVVLGGTLSVELLAGYEPTGGESFTIVTTGEAGTLSGRFDAVAGDGVYDVQYTSNSVVLEIITPPTCAGDLDGSASVGVGDLLEMLASWGTCVGCAADLDGDDAVGVGDLLDLLAAWGPCE